MMWPFKKASGERERLEQHLEYLEEHRKVNVWDIEHEAEIAKQNTKQARCNLELIDKMIGETKVQLSKLIELESIENSHPTTFL